VVNLEGVSIESMTDSLITGLQTLIYNTRLSHFRGFLCMHPGCGAKHKHSVFITGHATNVEMKALQYKDHVKKISSCCGNL
jgi:hypothetical protein